MDDFNTLGVPANATPGTIKAAWRKLVRKNHPDLSGNSEAATQRLSEINAAYDRIVAGVPRRDPEARAPRGPKEPTRPFTFDDFKTFWETKRPRQKDDPASQKPSPSKKAADDFRTFDADPRPKPEQHRQAEPAEKPAPDVQAARRTPGPRPASPSSETDEPREPYVSASFEAGRRAARAAYARAKEAGQHEKKPRRRPGIDLDL